MAGQNWRGVWEHYQHALGLPKDQQEEYLLRVGQDDPEVVSAVRDLLADGTQLSGDFHSLSGTLNTGGAEDGLQVGGTQEIGPYRLLGLLGMGGMGCVYEAVQDRPLRRKVALKFIRPGMDNREVLARFDVERQALAMMDHQNIARVFDAGRIPGGGPFFAMEFVPGLPLTSFCDAHQLGIRQRLELFIPVCEAIQHAHQKGIIHRDLKPTNILVVEQDGKPLAKVIDFGLAKAMEVAPGEGDVRTQFGMVAGTFAYMSPEQASLGSEHVDTRSDIYSLGIILYELLTGCTPLNLADAQKGGLSGVLARVRTEDPAPPSSKLSGSTSQSKLASQRSTSVLKLVEGCRGELDWIVMKAIEKDPGRRYDSAGAFARDLRRHLDGEPVEAAPQSNSYRLRKFTKRHRGALAVAAAFALVLLIATTVSILQATRAINAERAATRERDRAYLAERTASQERDRALAAEAGARQERDRAFEAEARTRVEQQLALQQERRADVEAATAKAVSNFLENDLLAQASTRVQATPGTRPDRDMKVVTALQRASARVQNRFDGQPEVKAAILYTIGNTYADLGLFNEAQSHLEASAQLRKSTIGAHHPDTLKTFAKLVTIYRSRGDFARAEEMGSELLATQTKVLGAQHPDTLATRHTLGAVYRSLGKYELSEKLYLEALAGRRRALGENDPETLRTMNNLGLLYLYRGRYREAEQLHLRTLEARQRTLGDQHPDTLISKQNLGLTYWNLGENQKAESTLAETLNVQRAVLGEAHAETLNTMNNLGNVYVSQNRYSAAADIYRKVVDIQARVLGARHASTLNSLANLGNVYQMQGQPHEAERTLREVMEGQIETLGPRHPDTLRTKLNLGVTYTDLCRFDRAEALLNEVVDQRRQTMGTDHPNLLNALHSLAGLYIATGQLNKAEGLADQVVASRVRVHGDGNAKTIEAQVQQAQVACLLGKYQKAESILANVRPASAKTTANGLDLDILGVEALLQYQQGKIAAARESYSQLLDLATKRFGERHPSTIVALYRVAALQQASGNYVEAERSTRRLLALDSELNRDTWERYAGQAILGGALLGQGQSSQAEPLLLAGYQGLVDRFAQIPPASKPDVVWAARQLIRLYETNGSRRKAEEWREKLQARQR